MSEVITARSVGSGIVDISEDFILSEEPLSRLVFHAQIHKGGIRGKIIRQRRESSDDIWTPEKAIHIRALGKNETINLEVDTRAVSRLYGAIAKLANILEQRGVEYGENHYAVVDPNAVVITDENKAAYVRKILEAGYDEEIWRIFIDSNPDLATRLSYVRVQEEKAKTVAQLQERLARGGFSETTGPDSWQKWIYENSWLFGANYKKPIEKARLNISGIMPDYLFPKLDGFVDILEIKLPNDEVIVKDPHHHGSWRWSSGANTAIGQVINYLGEIDRLKLEIERNIKSEYGYEVNLLKPHAYILIGDSSTWAVEKKEGLRKMNHALHGIDVVTYKDLLDRGNQSIGVTSQTLVGIA